jgi:beta-galactosidase
MGDDRYGDVESSPRRLVARRRFLQATGAGALSAAAWTLLGSRAAAVPASVPQGAAAQTWALNAGWRFGPWTADSERPGFDDRDFETVAVPHCVTPLGWREWDASSWERVWTYRRHFDAPPASSTMRTFLDFTGALTSVTPTFNGQALPLHQGGYLPFSYELTDQLTRRDNVLALKLDATWQNVPPDGSDLGAPAVDYFEPGGLYRDVSLRMVPQTFIADVFAKPVNVLDAASRQVQVQVTADAAFAVDGPVEVSAMLLDGGRPIARATVPVTIGQAGPVVAQVTLDGLGGVSLWDVDHPNLYTVLATLSVNGQPVHDFSRRIGFREARFENDGFFLNGSRFKLFGLNRHQVFPFAGMSMPPRVQRHDAVLLKREFNCNMVRCSHYPQSEHFLDACDELGIMIWEETPGWGYLGDTAFQDLVVQNVHDMVVRDRNRPSVIVWGVQVNESPRDPDLYTRTKELAYSLDGTRQTSGSNTAHNLTNWVQEVFAYDDYGHSEGSATLSAPIAGVPYLVSEAVGALDGPPGYRRTDVQDVQQVQARLHAQVHNIAGGNDAYCGLLGWCAFDYDSLAGYTFQSIKWPGIADTFRVPKPGAAFYQAQVSPQERAVIAPAFYWDFGPTSPVTDLGAAAVIWSNCDRIEAYLDGAHYASLAPDTTTYPHIGHPPFYLDTTGVDAPAQPDLRLDGYVGDKLVLSRSFAGDPAGDRLEIWADDAELVADGSDATRVAFRAVDRYGAPRPYVAGSVAVEVDGPGAYVGDVVSLAVEATPQLVDPGESATVTATLTNAAFPLGDNGGVGAVYVRTRAGAPGSITVRASHPTLGSGTVRIRATPPPASGQLRTDGPDRPPSQVLTGTTVSLQVPDGWTVTQLGGAPGTELAPGRSATARWRVTAPASVVPAAPTAVTAVAGYAIGGQPAGTQATAPVFLATPIEDAFDNRGISDDADPGGADLDGTGKSYSRQALAAAGMTPGATVQHAGISFRWPDTTPGQPDNVLGVGRTLLVSGRGATLGFLGASTFATGVGRGKVFYADGTDSDFSFLIDQNTVLPGPYDETVATTSYYNTATGKTAKPMYVFYSGVPIDGAKDVKAITLLDGGFVAPNGRIRGVHVFAVGVG